MNSKDKDLIVHSKVREFRQGSGMKQDELAAAVNATRQTIISIEKGNYVPSVLLAMRICEVLGKSVEEVFWYEKR